MAATDRWYPTVRLAIALLNAGCLVEAVCPPGHPVSKTRAANHIYNYNGLMPLVSLERAITASNPDLIVPADDLATRQLHQLYNRERRRAKAGTQICELIERSLGAAPSFEVVTARSAFMQMAREEGVRVPETQVINNSRSLHNWITRTGFPFVLKANGTSGGDGVKVVNTVEEAQRAFRKLQAPPLLARAIKHALVDRDLTLVWPSVTRRRHVVNAQEFVAGHEATSTIACWEGTVLASLHFEVLEKTGSTGHATVVRIIEHPEMSAAAERIARRLKLSGLHGLDFMLEAHTGNAYLLEINPRTTQVGHLTLGPGHDLPAALHAAITGTNIQPAPKVTENDTIALFPQEWKRDPASPFLLSAYHDVPWRETALVSSCVDKLRKHGPESFRKPVSQHHAVSPARVTVPAGKSQARGWIAEQE
jgi:formate-dependent phosphoribosylglycinamide formyltransferase (GAR transformylase)